MTEYTDRGERPSELVRSVAAGLLDELKTFHRNGMSACEFGALETASAQTVARALRWLESIGAPLERTREGYTRTLRLRTLDWHIPAEHLPARELLDELAEILGDPEGDLLDVLRQRAETEQRAKWQRQGLVDWTCERRGWRWRWRESGLFGLLLRAPIVEGETEWSEAIVVFGGRTPDDGRLAYADYLIACNLAAKPLTRAS